MQINVNASDWQHMQQMAALGELTTAIVHDLKNQLACIGANVSLVEHLSQSDNVDKYTANAKRQLQDAHRTIEQIMRLGSKDNTYESFDLACLVEDVTSFFEQVSEKNICVTTAIEGEDHLIFGCQTLISNAILNLFSNAKEAIDEKGSINIHLTCEDVEFLEGDLVNDNHLGKCSVLTVTDTGCGIDPTVTHDIFQPFYTTKKGSKANAGMGLSNVIQTVRDHNGSMTVESSVGVGTTFKLYFKSA